MRWIRVVREIKTDKDVAALARFLKLKRAEAAGHCLFLFLELPLAAPDADVSGFSDVELDAFAGWEGKRGAFGAAFREFLCADGLVKHWDEINGAPMRASDREAERKADFRAKRRRTRGESPTGTGDGTGGGTEGGTEGGRAAGHGGDNSGDGNGGLGGEAPLLSPQTPTAQGAGARTQGQATPKVRLSAFCAECVGQPGAVHGFTDHTADCPVGVREAQQQPRPLRVAVGAKAELVAQRVAS